MGYWVYNKFMVTFGLLSSIFDYLTFGVLMLFIHANDVQFRTGWFVESVVSAALIVLVIRSSKPLSKSKPGKYLFITTITIAVVTLLIPYTPLAAILGFQPLNAGMLLIIASIILLYILTAEFVKTRFYKTVKY